MIKKLFIFTVALSAIGAVYLALWPVPVAPHAWDAPKNLGYVGPFAPNERLADLQSLSIGDHHGPEDIAVHNGMVFTTSQDGVVIKVDPATNAAQVFARTGGKPLGLEIDANDNLIIADAYKGLISVNPSGEVAVLTDGVGPNSPILYADDLDIGADGTIYFSDASTKFGAEAAGSTMAGSLLELMEHGRTGRLLAYNPRDKSTRIIAGGFSFANGVAMEPPHYDGSESVLMIETGLYRVIRVFVSGPRTGEHDVVIDNLPGFPDNINPGTNGTYWLGLVSPRSDWLDANSDKPFMRKLAMRLPESMRPKAENYGFVMQINSQGEVLQTLQDPAGGYPLTTGAIEGGDGWLYITSLGSTTLGRIRMDSVKRDSVKLDGT